MARGGFNTTGDVHAVRADFGDGVADVFGGKAAREEDRAVVFFGADGEIPVEPGAGAAELAGDIGVEEDGAAGELGDDL